MVNCCTAMKGSDVPAGFPGSAACFPNEDEWINAGKSCLIEPGGHIAVGPVAQETGILHGRVDLQKVRSSRRSLDVAGHRARPDIFKLTANRRAQGPVGLEDDESPS